MTDLHNDQEITQITDTLSITSIAGVRRNSTTEFDCIITVCQESVEANINCDYHHYYMSDGEDDYETGECTYDIFAQAATTLYEQLQTDTPTLIHCHRGRSRSVSVATAAYARHRNIDTFTEAFEEISSHRQRANPNEELRAFAERYIRTNKYLI